MGMFKKETDVVKHTTQHMNCDKCEILFDTGILDEYDISGWICDSCNEVHRHCPSTKEYIEYYPNGKRKTTKLEKQIYYLWHNSIDSEGMEFFITARDKLVKKLTAREKTFERAAERKRKKMVEDIMKW